MSDPADLILAVDQGTSAAKVVVFDDRGRPIASAGAETPVSYPEPTWMESDAEDWWRAVRAAIRAVLSEPAVASHRVRAVGLCGLMHSLVPVGVEGRALCAPILWPDQRATREVESLEERRDEIARLTGSRLSTMHALPRLIWLREYAPAVLAATRAFLQLILTGSHDFTPHHFTTALKLIAYGIVDVQPLISHHFPLERTADALELTASRQGLKAMVRMD